MQKDKRRPYRYLPCLAMLSVAIMLTIAVLSNKIITIAGYITMAGTLFIPLWFILSDIIAEIYGYKIARQIIWLSFLCHFLFSSLCWIALKIPSPSFWHGQHAYDFVVGDLIRITMSAFIAYIVSGMINVYLILKWKFLLRGKYFWLRSICASTIGGVNLYCTRGYHDSISCFNV